MKDRLDYKRYEAGPWVIHAENDITDESHGEGDPILLGFKFIGLTDKLQFVGNGCDIVFGVDQGVGGITINGICIDHNGDTREMWISRGNRKALGTRA